MAKQVEKSNSDMIDKAEAPVDGSVQKNYFSTFSGKGWLYGLLAFVVLLIVFALGAAAANHHRGMIYKSGNIVRAPGFPGELGYRHGGYGGGMGSNMTQNGQTRLNGVVTAVNGSNFTVAGHGSTTNVATNASTQYQGGNTVKQNDSVIVYGTSDNGTITATQTIINP